MRRIGVLTAMRLERDALLCGSDIGYGIDGDYIQGLTENGTPYLVAVCGIGKVNAAVWTYRMIAEKGCTEIVSFGCAGGLSYEVGLRDIIAGDSFMYYDVDCGKPNAYGQVQGCPQTFVTDPGHWRFTEGMRHGLIVTGDAFVGTQTLATAITQNLYPERCPLAVDMESAAIAQVCHWMGKPFVSVRVISDNPFTGERTYDDFWRSRDMTLASVFGDFVKKE